MLTTSRKKVVGDSSGNTMVQNRLPKRAPSIAAASIRLLGIACKTGEKEQEIVADPAPRRGGDHQGHRLVRIQHVVPAVAEQTQIPADQADIRVEHEQPQHAGNSRRHRIGPDQQGAIGAGTLEHPIGHHGQPQGHAHRDQGHQRREDRRRPEGRQIDTGLAAGTRNSRSRRTATSGRTDRE